MLIGDASLGFMSSSTSSSSSGHIWVGCTSNLSISEISVASQSVVATPYTLPSGSDIQGMAYCNGYIYIANYGKGPIEVLNATTGALVTSITTGASPFFCTVYGTKVYFGGFNSNIYMVDSTTNSGVTSYNVNANYSTQPAIYYDGTNVYAYVADYTSNKKVRIINLTTNTFVESLSLPGGYSYGALLVNGNIWVASYNSSAIYVINPSTNTIIQTISNVSDAFNMIQNGNTVYVSSGSGGVYPINATTYAVGTGIAAGSGTAGLAISGNYLYTANSSSNNVSIINMNTNTFISNIGISGGPNALCAGP